jgi:hypothetical protein
LRHLRQRGGYWDIFFFFVHENDDDARSGGSQKGLTLLIYSIYSENFSRNVVTIKSVNVLNGEDFRFLIT